MTTLKHLLSDKFVEFSTAVAEIHKEIKDLNAKFQAEVRVLQDKAKTLKSDFELWEKEWEEQPVKTVKPEDQKQVDVPGHPLKDPKRS